jgi:DNA gyrase, A subunit
MEMLADINKDTVDFVPNFDETEKEPTVLPSRFPNLLVNGTTGIAVGMATNIPPHNLKEVIGATVKIIDNRIEEDRETSIDEIMQIIKGPDFPMGAEILGRRGIEEAYRTGRGKIKVRAVTDIEAMPNGKHKIVVTELPYMVNKALLIQKIVELVKTKRVEGITDVRDESSREGIRVVIELKKDTNANVLLNQLYKHTQLQDTFGVNMLALVDGVPKILNISQMLGYYLKHQEDVVTRRTKYDLNKAEERAHILKGLLIALDNIDEVINIIRSSKSVQDAKNSLIERFGLTEVQAQAIVDMRLRALTGLEREKLEAEYKELMDKISYLKAILADEKKLLGVIKDELLVISQKYGDERRTALGRDVDEVTDEELIERENIVIAMTKFGYIKRMPEDLFKAQNRGGKGIRGMQTIDEDYIENLIVTTTHNYLMFFTNTGRVYRLKGYEIPEAGRTARGVAIVNLLQLQAGEKITAVIPLKSYEDGKYLFMATRNGMVKKTDILEYQNVRKTGLTAIVLRDNDELIEVKATNGDDDIFLITKKGMSIRFNEKDVRQTGRTSMGVKGIHLGKDDIVISMQMSSQGEKILLVTENGMGKRTLISEFNAQNRGGKGVKCYKITEKTGDLVGAKIVTDENDVMIITTEGIIIRTSCDGISTLGRVTSGVKVINLNYDNNVKVASMTEVQKEEFDDEDPEGENPEETEDTEDTEDTEVSEEQSSEEDSTEE